MPEFSGASSFPFHSPLAPLPSNRTLSFTSTPRFPKLANEETLSPSPPLIFESLIPFLGRWNEGKRGVGVGGEQMGDGPNETARSPTTLKIAVPSAGEKLLLCWNTRVIRNSFKCGRQPV